MEEATYGLCHRVRSMCAEALTALRPGPFADAVGSVAERLADDTLVVAVGGRLNAGKSTLVNALLGQRLAPTGGTETTLVSAWFRSYHMNRVWVHFKDGRPPASIPSRVGGGVPQSLPYDHSEVSHLVVEAANKSIDRAFTLMDTPGRDAVSALDDYSMASIRKADALILAMPQPGEGDAAALREFQETMRGSRLSAANVLGVLTRIDQISEGTDLEEVRREADKVAGRSAGRMTGLVAEVIPVATKLAETSRSERLTEQHRHALGVLAAADRDTLEEMLFDHEDFLSVAPDTVPVDTGMRQELLDLLAIYGIRQAVDAIDCGARDLSALRDALCERSGINRLLERVQQRLVTRADPLRVDAAMAPLWRAVELAGPAEQEVAGRLRGLLRELARHPAMRWVELAEAAQAQADGVLPVPDQNSGQLHMLMAGVTDAQRVGLPEDASPEELRRRIGELVGEWKMLEASLPRRARLHTTVVREMFEALYFSLL
ncbi:GTPase [Planotetraspora silvatica]|uniref:GTPase n=1 Tax=Planotetraspora silvatica TaxID=234614 RepID=A0A8J3UWK9_9ACTN|nr:dynamin family protein [Planotetraspora silvatica]GII50806.1 GTPase [Planotetraspora silvatica]